MEADPTNASRNMTLDEADSFAHAVASKEIGHSNQSSCGAPGSHAVQGEGPDFWLILGDRGASI
eukprot:4901195-Amphidinium_carterae.1